MDWRIFNGVLENMTIVSFWLTYLSFSFKTFYCQVAKNLDPDQAERIFETLDSVREAVNKKTRKVEILLFYFNEIFPELLIITILSTENWVKLQVRPDYSFCIVIWLQSGDRKISLEEFRTMANMGGGQAATKSGWVTQWLTVGKWRTDRNP